MGILRILQMIIDSLKWHCLLNLNNNFQKFSLTPTLAFILAMTQACRWVTTNTAQDWLRKACAANYYILPHSKTLLIFMMVQLCQPWHHQHGWTSRSVCVLVYGLWRHVSSMDHLERKLCTLMQSNCKPVADFIALHSPSRFSVANQCSQW